MKKIFLIILEILILSLIIQIISCKDNKGVTEPGSNGTEIPLSGIINFPSSSGHSELTIGFGQAEYHPDNNGKFTFSYNPEIPGMATVFSKEGIPQLMGVLTNPNSKDEFKIDIHSTALSLVFLNPFICSPDPATASLIINKLETFSELDELEKLLENKLLSNSSYLTIEDSDIQNALQKVFNKYISSLSDEIPKKILGKVNEDPVIIIPVSIVSGHQVQHDGENKFSISNWYGRWAKCILPTDSIYLPPNNDFLDIGLKPWAPSITNFDMEIIPNEPSKKITVYGLGVSGKDNIKWEDLTLYEREQIMYTGVLTVFIEFLPRTLSLLTNCPFTFGNKDAASQRMGDIVRWILQSRKIVSKGELYISNGDSFGFIQEMLKEIVALIVTDDDFRELVLQQAGVTLSETAFKNLGIKVLLPLNVLYIADDLTGTAKTVLGLTNAGYKTTFEIYSEEYKFGNVNGNVYDKTTGVPIQNASVQLLGDENNPMNPNYTYTTDATGGFWFENILEGKKSLLISKEEYGSKTIEIEVKENETTKITVELSKEKGTITGKVLNDILIKNGITPANFSKECHLDITEIGGDNQSYSFWIGLSDNGIYRKDLTPGTYEIKAWHEDYKEASVTVTIPGNETTQVEDLILQPDCKMSGSVYYDINFDGHSEYSYSFNADVAGGSQPANVGTCPNSTSRYALPIAGINQTEIVEILIDTSHIKGTGFYDIGSMENCGCQVINGKSTVYALSKRFKCSQGGYETDLFFSFPDDPNNLPCNCGITNGGNIVLTKYGNQLTDVIEGSINVTLAGWKNCTCSCCDGEGNYTVDCATMQIDINFKILVGTLEQNNPSLEVLKSREENIE